MIEKLRFRFYAWLYHFAMIRLFKHDLPYGSAVMAVTMANGRIAMSMKHHISVDMEAVLDEIKQRNQVSDAPAENVIHFPKGRL